MTYFLMKKISSFRPSERNTPASLLATSSPSGSDEEINFYSLPTPPWAIERRIDAYNSSYFRSSICPVFLRPITPSRLLKRSLTPLIFFFRRVFQKLCTGLTPASIVFLSFFLTCKVLFFRPSRPSPPPQLKPSAATSISRLPLLSDRRR